jgi:2-polyprenyl-3-methyl-5-hydroxy-6-metoxy-1,4-benzoquinol methylase
MAKRICWCGNQELVGFNADYGKCVACGTLVSVAGLTDDELKVSDDETAFYGKQYWFEHQSKDLGFPNIVDRARNDLTDRNLHWLKTLLRYQLPPANVLELGCSHGSFVGLLRQAGYNAEGIELSPWVVEFARKSFDVPVSVGPAENLDLTPESFDLVVLMDVLEHLPDPEETMRHALSLVRPNGLLLIQTPEFKEEMDFDDLLQSKGAFLEMLRPDEHIYLFSQRAAKLLFSRLSAENLVFEPAIFSQYDMFFVVSRMPIDALPGQAGQEALLSKPTGRFVQAMLDLDARAAALSEKVKALSATVEVIEDDRADRLTQIHTLTKAIHDMQASRPKGKMKALLEKVYELPTTRKNK